MTRVPRKRKKKTKALVALFYARDFKRSKIGWDFVANGERIKDLNSRWDLQFTSRLYNECKFEISRGRSKK